MPFDYNCTTLVQMVEKYPCIWNRGDLDYRNKAAKDRSWSEICQSLEPNFNTLFVTKQTEIENTLRDKWSNIRDTMVRYLRQRCSKPNTKRYHYADACHFLEKLYSRSYDSDVISGLKMGGEDMVELDPSMQNVMCVLGEEEESMVEEYDNRVKIEQPEDYERERANEHDHRGSTSEEESRPPPRKKTKIPQNYPDSNHHVKISVPKESQPDEDEAFFISVLPHVRSLSQDEKLDFRMGVLQMIKDAKKRAATTAHP